MIEIMNLRHCNPSEPYDVRVDRKSVLGNPFYMANEEQRDEVCNKHIEWFNKALAYPGEKKLLDEMVRLVELYRKHSKLRLFCWCAPKRCHCETIRDHILGASSNASAGCGDSDSDLTR